MNTQMMNTPGYYYAASYWLAAFIIVCIYRDTDLQDHRETAHGS